MKPLKDYSFIKGFNYDFPGEYDHETVDRQMGYAERLTLNSCRLFMWMDPWKRDPEGFIRNLKDLVQTAWDHGISTTPILMMTYFTDDQKSYWLAEDHSNAEIPGCYYPENWSIGEGFAGAVIDALKDHPGLLFWDVMNEPGFHGFLSSVDDPVERQRRYDMVWAFLKHFIAFVREKDPVNALGVGHAFIEDTELSDTGDLVDIIIFHDYLETKKQVEATYKRAMELSEKYGKPVINNETGCIGRSNPYELEIQMCNKYKIGYYLFELMIEPEGRLWSRVHGIVYPDGTVRDPSIVAAIMGFFRNRGETAVLPDVNQEHFADRAVAKAKKLLYDYASSDELLEICENMANILEAGELVPMVYPPTRKIEAWRRSEKKDDMAIRDFTFQLMETLRKACNVG